jgi:hypothetical protein
VNPRRRVDWAPTLLWIAVLAGPTPARADTPEEIFERGNRAYDAGRYEEAAEAYRTVLRYQVEDARVEYNLGNAEFRRGNLGRAILHYERARRLDPTDPDVRANLDYARSQRLDRVPPPERPAVVAWLIRWQDRIGADRLAWAALGLVWAGCGVLVWGLSVPGRWRARQGWSLAALVTLLALVGASWYGTVERQAGDSTAVVVARLVEVLAGPGENNATLATIHEGLDVEVWAEREEWLQVRLPNGVSGWVSRHSVERV